MSARGTDALSASNPRRSAWVSAHAGSGKTYTLANRVTRLLLEGARPERILCLTYTKSAAAEMQGRLFDQLGSWAMLDDDVLSAKISEIGGGARNEDGLRRARRLFALALETPGGLKIQTIHSFCQYLLARFPLEAGISPGFRVLDEQTARELIGEARARVLEMAGNDEPQLAGAVAHLVTQTSESRLQQVLDAALGNDRGKLERFFANLSGDGAAFVRAVRHGHGAGEHDTHERIAAEFCQRAKAEEDRLKAVIAWLHEGTKNDIERADALAFAIGQDWDAAAYPAFRAVFLTKDGALRKKLATAGREKAAPALFAFLNELGEQIAKTDERYRAAHTASLAEAALTLADAVRNVYAKEKRFRGVLDYNDLIAESLKLLKKREAAAWVLYKMDGGLDHILIDEAQDTSPEQWDIVRALTEEFFAGEGIRTSGSDPRTIFAVGDEKQSIFSFQGADPVQFEVNRRHFALHAQGDGDAFVDVQLVTSRRSAPEVLAFVDTVFSDPEASEGLTSAEGEIRHAAHRSKAKGCVEFWPALKSDDSPDTDPWRPVDVEPTTSPVRRLAERIATNIKMWTDGKTRLPGHDEPIRPGDIMILMPRREPFASEIIRQLKERGIAVAGADRIRLTQQIAVMDLIALGRFALLPEDDLNLAALLRSPMLGLSEEELYALCVDRQGTVWRELEQREGTTANFGFAFAFLREMRARADYVPPYEFYATALITHGMRKRLLARLGTEANDAIDEFLSLTLSFEALNTPSLQMFLHWIERGMPEIKRDMERGRNEVRVMTVHGAKGLEADIVILPDTTTLPDPPGKRGELLFTPEGEIVFPVAKKDAPEKVQAAKELAEREALKEHRRLLYVALTRARERLYICGFENKRGVRAGSWYDFCERAAKATATPVQRGDETILVLGNAEFETVEAAKAASPYGLIMPDWAMRPAPEEAPRARIIRPSEAVDADEPAVLSPLDETGVARFQRGLLVHSMLARLPEVADAERHALALNFLRVRNIPEESAAALVAETLAVLAHPDVAAAFTATARAEVGIAAELPELGPGARINGRIDRLAVTDEEVLAVDFKTNRPPPVRPEDVPHLYIAQMTLYRAALARIFPGKRISCALVWTDGPTLMRLPDALMDAEVAAIRARFSAP